MYQTRQTIPVIFCISESVALVSPNIANVFTKLITILQKAFETAAQMRGAQKNGIRQGILQKKIILLIDRFLYFFANGRKSGEKKIHQKEYQGSPNAKIVQCRQSYSNGRLPSLFILIYYFARSMHDVACEFACAVAMCKNN